MRGNSNPEQTANSSGHLLIIGGGYRPDYLMREFISLAGGIDSRILIFPTASNLPEITGREIKSELEKLGCINVDFLNPADTDVDDEANLERIQGAGGIFFSGGDQNKLASHLLKTQMLRKIKAVYQSGGVIAGTSAGAAIMSKVMIAGSIPDGSDYVFLPFRNVFNISARLSEGFGFLSNIIIDQHFNTRNRTGRLKDAVKRNPKMLGIGIDESTAIIVYSDNSFQVIGENNVTVVAIDNLIQAAETSRKVTYFPLDNVHTLYPGERFLFNMPSEN